MIKKKKDSTQNSQNYSVNKNFHVEFLNSAQKLAWASFQKHDVLFMVGPPGSSKTFLASAFAVHQILSKQKKKIVLTRPIMEAAGEKLGYLPGDFDEKVAPYMMPLFEAIDKIAGNNSGFKDQIMHHVEVAPIAYLRGRNFYDSVCIFDEAQNANEAQLKLFLTRFNDNCKLIITGDPKQSDLNNPHVPLMNTMNKLKEVEGVGVIQFSNKHIVRHPLVTKILEKLETE